MIVTDLDTGLGKGPEGKVPNKDIQRVLKKLL
jgi:hypothetical protein